MQTRLLILFIVLICSCKSPEQKKPESEIKQDSTEKVINENPLNPPNDTIYSGLGTEPFWLIYVMRNGQIIYQPADEPEIKLPYEVATSPDQNTERFISKNDSIQLELTFVKKNCNDGMSDRVHPFEATLVVNALRLSGCGRTFN